MPGIWIVVIWSASLGIWMCLFSFTSRALKDPNAKPDGYTGDFAAWPMYDKQKTRPLTWSERLPILLSGIGIGIIFGLIQIGFRAAAR